MEPVAIWLQNFAQQHQPNENYKKDELQNNVSTLRNCCTVFTSNNKDDNIIIDENNDFKDCPNYISVLVAPLEVDSKNELLNLIQDKVFLKFVDDSYQAFSDLNMKINQIIDIDSDRFDFYRKLSPELIETINKLFPNNILDEMDFHFVKYILWYCGNKISQLGTLQLYNAIQNSIKKYKNNNDENELKSGIKHQIIKIYHQNLIPIKEPLNKLLQELVNKYDKKKLSDREKLLKLENIIPQLGSGLEKFAIKYNIPVSIAEVIKLLQVGSNLEEILSKMPHDVNGNIIENEDFLRKNFFDISDKLLTPIFEYNNKSNSTLNYIRYILFNFVYRINSIVDYNKMVSSNDSYLKPGKVSYPELLEYDNYNTWDNISDDKLAPGFNYEFDRREANQKMKEIADENGYVDVLDTNGNFIYINPEQTLQYGTGMSAYTIDTSKISMQELIILFKNKIAKETVNVFRNILNSNLFQVDNLELKNIICDEIIKGINRIEHTYKILEQFLIEEEETIGDNNVIMNQILGINGAIKSNGIDNLMKFRDILTLQRQGKSNREIYEELNVNVEKFLSHARRKVPQTKKQKKISIKEIMNS